MEGILQSLLPCGTPMQLDQWVGLARLLNRTWGRQLKEREDGEKSNKKEKKHTHFLAEQSNSGGLGPNTWPQSE